MGLGRRRLVKKKKKVGLDLSSDRCTDLARREGTGVRRMSWSTLTRRTEPWGGQWGQPEGPQRE